MSGWSTPSYSALYKSFNPDEASGLARLIELIVFLRQGPMSLGCLIDILHDINEGIQNKDFTTFIQKNCSSLSFVVIDGIVKCKFDNR